MSSLIDRQAAIEVASKKCYELRGVFGEIEDGLNELPTVDAIPKEWIKDYIGSGVSDDIFQRNRKFVLNMIKDWEKENGTNAEC